MSGRIFLRRKFVLFDIFFCFLTNTVFLNKGYIWQSFTLEKTVFVSFFSFFSQTSCFILFKFLNVSKKFWEIFWRITSVNYRGNLGFFTELELVGLGFRIRRITYKVYRFFWGQANYIYMFLPGGISAEYFPDERAIFFFGFDFSSVNGIASYLMLLKKMSCYRVKGFVRPGKIIRLNAGKQR